MSSGRSPATLASSACGCSSCLAKSVAHVTSGGVRRVAPSCLTRRLGLAPARPRVFSRRLHPRIAASDFVGEYTSSSVLRFVARPSNRIPAARSAQHLPSRPAPHLVLRLRLTTAPPHPLIPSSHPSTSSLYLNPRQQRKKASSTREEGRAAEDGKSARAREDRPSVRFGLRRVSVSGRSSRARQFMRPSVDWDELPARSRTLTSINAHENDHYTC